MFLAEDIQSDNGLLIRSLIERLDGQHGNVPEPYLNFVADLGKFTSVCGFLQSTSNESLQYLKVKAHLY